MTCEEPRTLTSFFLELFKRQSLGSMPCREEEEEGGEKKEEEEEEEEEAELWDRFLVGTGED